MDILVIDDDQVDREAVRRNLLRSGKTVSIAEAVTGREGLDKIKDKNFDCVLLDYFLPDMNGINMLKELYDENCDLPPCPIIMLTGQGNESIMIHAIRYGAQEYLVKDHMSSETLNIALRKAREIFDLKTERSKTERQLIQAQKMEALGQLTGGIAHDFNNLLTIIYGHTSLLETMLGKKSLNIESLKNKVQIIHKCANRGADLIQRLMLFSRQASLETQNANLNDILNDVQELLSRTLGETIDIEIIKKDDLWITNIDKQELEHAIINMCVNARDAMPDGGKLILETKNTTINADCILHSAEIEPGKYVELSISDNGSGIDQETQEKIFDPFFTTKDIGKGTGLGLSTVYGFIKKLGGTIHVYSEKGVGTCFKIYLPQSDKAEDTQEAQADKLDIRGGSEVVLLVEDEPEIRELTSMLLKNEGYVVIEAEDGVRAIEIFTQNADKIDLLFTDIAMPGDISGIQLAARAQVLNPDIKILFTTGYTKNSIPDFGLIDSYDLLNKPYNPANMFEKVRKILDIE